MDTLAEKQLLQNPSKVEKAVGNVSQSQNKEAFKFRQWNLSCKLYLGNLGEKANKYEIEDIFKKYGKLKNVWVAKNPPGFAFLEYENPKDAEEAFKMVYGVRLWEKPCTNQPWQCHNKGSGGQAIKVKAPTEDRPGDWLCRTEGCRNVNFSWRETCNKCNTRNPYIKETREERNQRIYGNNRPYNGRQVRSHLYEPGREDFNRSRPPTRKREYPQHFHNHYPNEERNYRRDRNHDRNQFR